MTGDTQLEDHVLIIISPAFPANESPEQSPWLPAKQSLIRCLNRNFPTLEIVILALQFPESKTEYLWRGNRVIPFGGANIRRGHNLPLWYKVFRTMKRLKKGKKVLGIISFWCTECCLAGSYFGRIYGIRHLCWISGQDAKKENKFVRRIRPKNDELAAMSDFLSDEFFKNHGIRPKFIIPDAVDTSLFSGEQPQRTIDIMGAGNLIPLKRYDIFIEAVSAVSDKRIGIQAILCGSGSEEEKIKKLVNRCGLESVVCLTGLVPQQEVLQLMRRTKVFLHTSDYEGFGNVCIEALFAGAHVISFTRPMKQPIPHWHIVSSTEEMIATALEILQQAGTAYTQVLPFDMNDSAKEFMSVLTSQ